MTRFPLLAAFCILALPAIAQDAPIYAPCLQQFPAPDEIGAADDYITAMESAGWSHLTDAVDLASATPPLAEIDNARILFPAQFGTALDAQAYVDRAAARFEQSIGFMEIFTRDGLSAAVSAAELDPGQMSVFCTFAGLEVPGVQDALKETTQIEDFAFLMGSVAVDLPANATSLNVSALSYLGDETVLAPLSGREGLSLFYTYGLPE